LFGIASATVTSAAFAAPETYDDFDDNVIYSFADKRVVVSFDSAAFNGATRSCALPLQPTL
jgi:hypothetical protein